jgi:hypothetical protein
MTLIEAAKLALEALKAARRGHCDHAWADETMSDLHTAIESAKKQEPVAWAVYCDGFIALPAFEDEQAAIKEMQRRDKKWPHNKREVRALYDATPPAAPVQEQSRLPDYHPCTEVLIQGLKGLKGGGEVLAKWDAARAHVMGNHLHTRQT